MDKPKLGMLKELKDKQNVVGFAETDEGITVFVNRKLKMATIEKKIRDPTSPWAAKDVIPESVVVKGKQKKTDVIEIGEVRALADRKEYRPILGGCEIAPKNATWVGTGGAVVKYKAFRHAQILGTLYCVAEWFGFVALLERFGFKTEDSFGLLTNAHVTQNDVTAPKFGGQMVQPGSGEIIGKVIYSTRIAPKVNNLYDASLLTLDVPAEQRLIKGGGFTGHREPEVGEKVVKYGRTTTFTSGTLKVRNATISINYGDNGTFWFEGLDLYSYMSAPGDSGSVIMAAKDGAAVGLLFAGSSTTTIAIPMKKIVDKLKITF